MNIPTSFPIDSYGNKRGIKPEAKNKQTDAPFWFKVMNTSWNSRVYATTFESTPFIVS